MPGHLRVQLVGDPLAVRGRLEHGLHQGQRGWTRPIVERGTEPLPVARNSAADTSASSGTSCAGSSGIRGAAGTSAVIARFSITVSSGGFRVAVTALTDGGAEV
ncbi:hypothetical protein EASAB2608_02926 [Streptomyces sp. EAS-AB2608]|nr:hypothetical protein EASAB2608_02926 [Streptomyces sp. EAS-AB2608]